MAMGAGGVGLILGLALYLLVIYGIDLLFSMIGYGIMLILIGGSIWLIANAITYIFKLLKNKNFVEAIILIIILVALAIIKFPYIDKFAPFGFEYTLIAKKILGLGIISLAILIRENYNNEIKQNEKIEKTIFTVVAVAVIACSGFLIFNSSFNKTLFVSQNPTMETFWENKRTKKEAKKYNLRTELELVLEEYKKDNSLEFSREQINKIISGFGYKTYNGIACYALEDRGENWLVGMYYTEIMDFFSSNKNLGNTGNYYVDKNTFEITGVYSETKPQN